LPYLSVGHHAFNAQCAANGWAWISTAVQYVVHIRDTYARGDRPDCLSPRLFAGYFQHLYHSVLCHTYVNPLICLDFDIQLRYDWIKDKGEASWERKPFAHFTRWRLPRA
jgi:hypothetical protein